MKAANIDPTLSRRREPRPVSAHLLRTIAAAAAFLAMTAAGSPPGTATPVRLRASDGVTVFGAYYPATRPRATILLFHQAGSGKGEYASIAPRLTAAGFDALAIDQRAGGSLFGVNQTANAYGRPATYLDAEKDLEAAFAWARTKGRPVILWGSSYSSALVFRMAARHPGQVRAVLAFSPGEYLGDKTLVHDAARRVVAPIYVTSSADAGEIAAARSILAASLAKVRVQFAPRKGTHGSSTLIATRDQAGADANWQAVLAFLGHLR